MARQMPVMVPVRVHPVVAGLQAGTDLVKWVVLGGVAYFIFVRPQGAIRIGAGPTQPLARGGS